jgi:hypothetical protein
MQSRITLRLQASSRPDRCDKLSHLSDTVILQSLNAPKRLVLLNIVQDHSLSEQATPTNSCRMGLLCLKPAASTRAYTAHAYNIWRPEDACTTCKWVPNKALWMARPPTSRREVACNTTHDPLQCPCMASLSMFYRQHDRTMLEA